MANIPNNIIFYGIAVSSFSFCHIMKINHQDGVDDNKVIQKILGRKFLQFQIDLNFSYLMTRSKLNPPPTELEIVVTLNAFKIFLCSSLQGQLLS